MNKKMAIKKTSSAKATQVAPMVTALKLATLLVFMVAAVWQVGLLLNHYYVKVWPVKTVAFTEPSVHVDQQTIVTLIKQSEVKGLLAINLKKLREKIIANPWVKSITIQKKWPQTLIFSIQEYKAVALVNGHFLTERGVLLKASANRISPRLTLINYEGNINQNIDWSALLTEVETIKKSLASVNLELAETIIDRKKSWILKMKHQTRVNLGRKHRLKRVQRFVKVFAAIDQVTPIESIDLRYESGIAVKFKDVEAPESASS